LSVSCSPVRLVNRAVKKDPLILNTYLDSLIPEADTNCREYILKPKPVTYNAPTLGDVIIRLSDNKTERVKQRQEGRTERRESKDSTSAKKVEIRQEGKTDRAVSGDTTSLAKVKARQNAKVEKSNNRSILSNWFSIIAFIMGFLFRELLLRFKK